MSGLREALARALHTRGAWCGDCEFAGWDSCQACRDTCLSYADAALALLPEHRDEVRALIGPEPTCEHGTVIKHKANGLPEWRFCCDYEP